MVAVAQEITPWVAILCFTLIAVSSLAVLGAMIYLIREMRRP